MNKKLVIGIIGSTCLISFLSGTIVSTMLSAQSGSPVAQSTFTPPTFSFLKDLKSGNSGQDVRQLQIVLNSDKNTRVSDSGIGSKGQESTYFGKLTADAVMRFQLKYKINTTGFVDAPTRGKLNQIVGSANTAISMPTSAGAIPVANSSVTGVSLISGALPLAKEHLPRLYAVRPRQVKKGGTFTLVGAGFQVENTIKIGSTVFPHVLPQDSSNISFTIPTTSDIANGTYVVSIENSKGDSQIAGQNISIVITDNPRPTPIISGVTPTRTISLDETVTVTGSGFSLSNNSLVSKFGNLDNVSSSGTQITFTPRSLMKPELVKKIPAGTTFRLDFYVVNDIDASNVKGSVTVKL